MNYVIFDIDNCISDDGWRIPLIDWTPGISPDERYRLYHENAHLDKPRNLEVFVTWMRMPDTRIVFMTARPEPLRFITERWLLRYFRITMPRLMMRELGNHSRSTILKYRMLRTLQASFAPGDAILHAYDDRQDVVDMYNRNLIPASVLKVHDLCAYTPPEPKAEEYPVQGARPVVEPEPLPLCEVCGLSMNEPACLGAPAKTAGDILEAMAATFRERNAVYGNNYKMVAPLVRALFPNGVPPELVVTDQWHLFELKLVKLSRFAISNLTHMDSIHDDGVYSAMIESILGAAKETPDA